MNLIQILAITTSQLIMWNVCCFLFLISVKAIDSIHQVGVYCLALVPANTLPKAPLGGIHISETKQRFLEGALHPCNVLMCPHTCVTNLPKPRQKQPGEETRTSASSACVIQGTCRLDCCLFLRLFFFILHCSFQNADVGPASMIVGNLVAGKRIAQASGRDVSQLEDNDQARKVTLGSWYYWIFDLAYSEWKKPRCDILLKTNLRHFEWIWVSPFPSFSVPVFSRCSTVASSDNSRSPTLPSLEFQGRMHFSSYLNIDTKIKNYLDSKKIPSRRFSWNAADYFSEADRNCQLVSSINVSTSGILHHMFYSTSGISVCLLPSLKHCSNCISCRNTAFVILMEAMILSSFLSTRVNCKLTVRRISWLRDLEQ